MERRRHHVRIDPTEIISTVRTACTVQSARLDLIQPLVEVKQAILAWSF